MIWENAQSSPQSGDSSDVSADGGFVAGAQSSTRWEWEF